MESVETATQPETKVPGFSDGMIVAFAFQFPFISVIGNFKPEWLAYVGVMQVAWMIPAFLIAKLRGRKRPFMKGMLALCALVLALNLLGLGIMAQTFD